MRETEGLGLEDWEVRGSEVEEEEAIFFFQSGRLERKDVCRVGSDTINEQIIQCCFCLTRLIAEMSFV